MDTDTIACCERGKSVLGLLIARLLIMMSAAHTRTGISSNVGVVHGSEGRFDRDCTCVPGVSVDSPEYGIQPIAFAS